MLSSQLVATFSGRMPAQAAGVFSLRPSTGAISREGMWSGVPYVTPSNLMVSADALQPMGYSMLVRTRSVQIRPPR